MGAKGAGAVNFDIPRLQDHSFQNRKFIAFRISSLLPVFSGLVYQETVDS